MTFLPALQDTVGLETANSHYSSEVLDNPETSLSWALLQPLLCLSALHWLD